MTQKQQQFLEVKIFVPVGWWAIDYRPVREFEIYLHASGDAVFWHHESPSLVSYFILEKEVNRDRT